MLQDLDSMIGFHGDIASAKDHHRFADHGQQRQHVSPTPHVQRVPISALCTKKCNISKFVIAISHPDQLGFWEWLGQAPPFLAFSCSLSALY
jgi:hypothetical protein